MLINFWYAAELSGSLRDKPVKVRLLGQNVVLFRDSHGLARCLSNVCIHRCASLADGWVSGDRVVCPYHGWEFAGSGQCQRIPSLGPGQAPVPARVRVDSYPVQERYGIVFVFLGDLPEAERPPLMAVPEWDQPGWRCTTSEFSLKANYRRVVENALDPAHAEYVHVVGRRGQDPEYAVPAYDVQESEWGAGMEVRFRSQAGGFWKHFRDQSRETVAGTTFHGPSQFVTRIHIDKRMSVYQYAFDTPVDLFTTRSFLVSARNFFTPPLFDFVSERQNRVIVEEDRRVIEHLEPAVPFENSTADFSVKADAIQLCYRRKLKEWEARGWRIDTASLAAVPPGTGLHVIPSPGRRELRGWQFPPVPLVTSPEPAGEDRVSRAG
jgi:phenylpropionate dioxygenase-like ring-hydroxylating dioxygenase large terminal subunit